MRYISSLFLSLICAAALHAQPGTDAPRDLDEALRVRVALIARASRDSVVLRWAPSKPAVWLAGSKAGYRLERATVDGGRTGAFKALVDTAIKPWPYERWLAYAESHPAKQGDAVDYVAIAYNLLDQFGADGPARSDYSSDELQSIAERKNELEMRFGFAMYAVDRSADAAEGLGLRFVDRTVTPGATYIYRLYLAGSADAYKPDTGSATITALSPKEAARTPITATGGDGEILLRWRANRYYSSYYVERSENNGASFQRLNKVPLVTLRPSLPTEEDVEIYLDSTAEGSKSYLYRIYGTTPFADEDMLGDVRGATRDVTPPAKPFLPNPEHVAARRVSIRWEPGTPAVDDLAGFHIARGGTDSGPFTRLTARLLPPTAREFFDTTFRDDGSNYYLIEALDTAGNTSRSNSAYVALIDSTPPVQPRWIGGVMDSNGVVTLRIHANRERDLMGYRILRANAADHEFSVIRESFGDDDPVRSVDTIYHDTVAVRTLTRYAYYRVAALDRNHNESVQSQTLAVPRPDIVPPVSPVITDLFVTDSSVQLRFAGSSSEDAAYHTVLRRADAGGEWEGIARLGRWDSIYIDRSVKWNRTYEYAMRAVDSSGLASELSMSVQGRPYDPGVRPGVTNLTGAYDAATGKVSLRWEYAGLAEEHWFLLYRAGSDGALRSHARISSKERSFIDSAPIDGSSIYAVRVVTSSGAASPIEPKVEVKVGR